MGALLIALQQLTHQGEGMIVRRYGRKHGSGGMLFNAIVCLFAAIFFVIKDVAIQRDGLVFTKELVIYGLISCMLFAAGFYAMYVALQSGSFAITRLISSFSGIISIVFGILIFDEKPKSITYVAIALIFVSIFFMGFKEKTELQKSSFSLKWLVFVLISAISNGFIAVIQRMQQLEFDRKYDNEFMIISFVGACVMLLILSLWKERDKCLSIIKYGVSYGMVAGLFNGASNFLNLAIVWVIGSISAATPIRTGVGMVVSFAISIFLYKEKFTKMQFISAVIGIVALVLFKFA